MADVKWIKVVTDMFDNRKIKQIEKLPAGDSIIVIWFKLLCLAGSSNEQGFLLFTNRIPYNLEMLATEFNRPLNTIKLAITTFSEFGMIEIINDAICVCNWEKYQNTDGMDKIREQNRLRQQRHRERQKLLLEQKQNDVTLPVTLPVTLRNALEKDKDKDKEIINKGSKKDKINYQEIVDLYNDTCVSLCHVNKLTDSRKRAIRSRLKNYSLEEITKAFQKAEASDFLKGDNNKNWIADFDFVMRDASLAKILEGSYDNRKAQSSGNTQNSFQQNSYDFDALEKELMRN
jgi:predicted phage replisome organizer